MSIKELSEIYDTQIENASLGALNCMCDEMAFERYKNKIEELKEEFKKNIEILSKGE